MDEIRLIKVKEGILSDNDHNANQLRRELRSQGVFLLNVMASPGAGKTSLILRTAEKIDYKVAVMEADIDSTVDTTTLLNQGVHAIQLHTGGLCHLDAAMVRQGLDALDLAGLDLVVLENVGNLVCPAEFDTGATKNVAILSLPEGDDKPLKYPLIFQTADVVVINKIDYSQLADFDLEAFRKRVKKLNPQVVFFEVSCRTGQGITAWVEWLENEIKLFDGSTTRD